MEPIDIILILVIGLIVGSAVGYIFKAKKSGQKCIGCPHSKTCSGSCGTCQSACTKEKDQTED
jgi:hypothetical protein